MNRREFLSAAAIGAVGAATANGAGANSTGPHPATGPAPRGSEESRLATPPPGVEYFTQERLEKAVGGALVSTEGIRYEVVTYACYLWHPTPVLEKSFGRGFSEWELVRRQFG